MLAHDTPFMPPGLGRGRRAITATSAVTVADAGIVIDATSGTYDVTATAAATLGSGFSFGLYNSGSGTVTFNPTGAETVRTPAGTATTLALTQGMGAFIVCDGANWDVVTAVGLAASSSTPLTVADSAFTIVGSADATKTLKFEVDAQTAGADLTINTGAQTVDRTLTAPVLGANDTIATLAVAQTFTAVNTFSAAMKVLRLYASATDDYPNSRYYAKELIALHAHYGFLDESVLNFDGNVEPLVGHASSNMNATIGGSLSFDHHHDYQASGQYGAAGTLTRYANFYAQPYATAGTITSLMEYHAADPSGGGTIGTLYGFYCPNLTKGSTRWAFYSAGTTPSSLGGTLVVGGTTTVAGSALSAAGPTTLQTQLGAGAIYTKPTDGGWGFRQYRTADDSFFGMSGSGTEWRFAASYDTTGAFLPISFWTSDVKRMEVAVGGAVSVIVATEATSSTAASVTLAGGLGVVKRSYLGTISASFSGNVIAGVTDATAQVTGQVGEKILSTVSAAAVAATGTVGNITSISLTPGDWLITGFAVINGGATGLTVNSTAKISFSAVSATNGTNGDSMTQQTVFALVANGLHGLALPGLRTIISSTITLYFTEEVTYAAGSPTVAGTIIATRVR